MRSGVCLTASLTARSPTFSISTDFTSPGNYLFTDNIPASPAYFSLNGGNTKIADFGQNSDPSDFLNSGVQGANDPFNEFYSGSTLQSLTTVDLKMLDALGFNFTPLGLTGNTAEALQGGAKVALLGEPAAVNDTGSTTLSSATIKIANGSSNPVSGDELYINGQQSGTVANGLISVSWNDTTKTLTLSGTASTLVYAGLLNEISFQDTGTDASSGSHAVRTVTWSINDGTNSYSATSQITVDRAPTATNSTATDAVGATITATATSGILSHTSDLDGDQLTVSAVSDTAHGAGTVGSSVAGVYGHLTLNADGSYSYVADNAAAIGSAATGGHLQDVFSYTVSDGNGGTATASFFVTLDRAPVVIASNITLAAGASVAASSLFSATDPDGNAITTYAFEDTGPGHFVLNGNVVEPNNQEIDLTAAQLSQLTYLSVQGSVDALQIRVNDGTLWSNWTSFTVTPAQVIQTDGTTSLVTTGGNYFLDTVGSSSLGPELTLNGAALGPAQLGSWAPIGAVQTATGYDVAFKLAGANEYTVWATNSSGAYVSSLVGVVAGNDTTLELLETTFNQDLNGDTHIGLPPPTVIQTDGTTSLVTTGGNYFLDTVGSNSLGPELTLNGAALGPAQLGSWAPIGAVQTATGYDVALALPGANEFTVWAVNSSGAYVSSLVGVVAGNDTTLESLETTFNQDLNGDTHIGLPPPTVIQTDGTTSLVTTGGNYFLDTVGSNSLGPELTLNGAALGPAQLGSWTPIGAVQTATGYDVAFKLAGANEYTVWATNSSGAYVSSLVGVVAGNDTTLESLETTFNQDLNGDTHIGLPPPTVIQTDGTTSLVTTGGNYFLDTVGSNSLGPELTLNGAALGPAQLGSWAPIGAVQTATGYDVAFKLAGANEYTVWATNSSGAYVSSLVGIVPGNNTTVESLENTFQQDLNGDSHIGPPPPPPPVIIQTDGSTSLVQVGNNYFLDPVGGGTSPELTLGVTAFVQGQGGGWAPIGAVQTASGYDVAFKLAGTDDFTVWATNSNGAYVSSLVGVVPGNNATLESLETTFNQDLNHDGTIGVPSTTQMASTANVPSNSVADNFQFASGSGPVIQSEAGGASPQQSSIVSVAGTDVFVFAPHFGQVSIANFAPATDTIEVSKTVFANLQALLTATHDNSSGNAVITDAAHDTITLKGVTTAQLLAHQNDFHFI